jgi:DNA-cytosine methyltransferase
MIQQDTPALVAETTYRPQGQGRPQNFKTELILALLKRGGVASGVVVAGARLASSPGLLRALQGQNIDVVFAVPPAGKVGDRLVDERGRPIFDKLRTARWRRAKVQAPRSKAQYWAADLGFTVWGGTPGLHCFALSQGGIHDHRRQLAVGVAALSKPQPLDILAAFLGWSRWIRFVDRHSRKESRRTQTLDRAGRQLSIFADLTFEEKAQLSASSLKRNGAAPGKRTPALPLAVTLPVDARAASPSLGRFADRQNLNVVDLFAGAGGMGLGFLLARQLGKQFRLLFSGEIQPVYAATLQMNRDYMIRCGLVSDDRLVEAIAPLDLRATTSMERVQSVVRECGGVDILVGGPPCQGFSNANRNTWSTSNPNNRLVDTFLDYVARLRPKLFIMENVQGILWMQRHSSVNVTVAAHVAAKAATTGYQLHPKLLDAAWYGVPQHRSRFFLIGLHRDLGYQSDAFGTWGPYPEPTHGPSKQQPYVTLREAIGDLPSIANGHDVDEMSYTERRSLGSDFLAFIRHGAPSGLVWDHVVSTHAEYVIERYRRIPPGANWSAIAHMMTNYAEVGRTHSNIYRRLVWDEPSITISHYRKAMLIHPEQHRGLSLREAARLQSFPDWFRFAGTGQGARNGMSYKQQQIANAVPPLLAKALAERLLGL